MATEQKATPKEAISFTLDPGNGAPIDRQIIQ
jgi:hypothetical protein